MVPVSAFLKYTAIRLGLFIVPFGLLVAVGWHPLLSGGLSLIFAFCAAYIFFGKQRRELDEALQRAAERRHARAEETGAVRGDDEAAEDEAVGAGEDIEPADAARNDEPHTDEPVSDDAAADTEKN